MVSGGATLSGETGVEGAKACIGGCCTPSDSTVLVTVVESKAFEGVAIRLAAHAKIPKGIRLARFFIDVKSTRRRT